MLLSPVIIPEFLFLKYQGIHAPWEFAAGAKGLIFKMRKYSRWSEVHVDSSSRGALLLTADELEQCVQFSVGRYGAISQVWERVQRWRKDKDEFLLEPDITPEFERFALLISQGCKTPGFVASVLIDRLEVFEVPTESLWKCFLATCAVDLIASRKKLPEGLRILCDFAGQQSDYEALLAAADRLVAAVYDHVGYALEGDEPGDSLLTLVEDCGLQSSPSVEISAAAIKVGGRAAPWVEYITRTDSRLVGLKLVNGQVVVQVNEAHPCLQGQNNLPPLDDGMLWDSLGAALVSHLADLDQLQDFFDTWGAHLKRAALTRQRTLRRTDMTVEVSS